jgi:hypothetical protein
MQSLDPLVKRSRALWPVVAVTCLAGRLAHAETFSATDSVFAPASWSLSKLGGGSLSTMSASQVVDAYAAGSNARQSNLSPGGLGVDTWAVSILETFSFNPAQNPWTSSISISFDSRWVSGTFSWVGPAIRQGSQFWVGSWAYQLNSSNWQTYSFTGWGASTPDLSSSGLPIYFGFCQLNGGPFDFQSQFANFSVVVTTPAPGVAAPMVLCFLGGFGRRRWR